MIGTRARDWESRILAERTRKPSARGLSLKGRIEPFLFVAKMMFFSSLSVELIKKNCTVPVVTAASQFANTLR